MRAAPVGLHRVKSSTPAGTYFKNVWSWLEGHLFEHIHSTMAGWWWGCERSLLLDIQYAAIHVFAVTPKVIEH